MSETPSKTNQATPEALQSEIEALRAKNVQLLAELKMAKTNATDATTALEAAQGERDAAVADARQLRLDGPVDALVADVAVDGELFRTLFDKHYRFTLDDQGAVVILDSEGKPAMVTEPGTVRYTGRRGQSNYREERTPGKTRPAAFTAGDVALLAASSPDGERFKHVLVGTRASDKGAGTPYRGDYTPAKPTDAAPAQSFGLR